MDRRTLFQGLTAVTACIAAPAQSRTALRQTGIAEDDCDLVFPADRFRSLCGFIDSHVTEPPGSDDYYSYQAKAYEVGKVTSRDGEATIRKKVQHLFVINQAIMDCDDLGFSVSNGSMLKLAVSRKFDDFIEEAVNIWQVPLNRIDASDERTVLDYIDAELANARGTPLENKLRSYRQTFRAAGARTARELAVTPDTFVDPYDREIAPLKSAWEKVCYLSENRQAVKRGGRWGYLDENGRMAVEPRFQSAFSFSEGRAPVALDGRWGFIDLAGAIAVPARYHDVRAFRDGQAEVTMDGRTWTSVGPTGQSL